MSKQQSLISILGIECDGEVPVFEFGECGVLLHQHYFQVHSDSVIVTVRGPIFGQIELFNHLQYFKLYNYVKQMMKLND